MKVKDLIIALQSAEVNAEAEVYVWIDGTRYPIVSDYSVDPWDRSGRVVDINAYAEEATNHEGE